MTCAQGAGGQRWVEVEVIEIFHGVFANGDAGNFGLVVRVQSLIVTAVNRTADQCRLARIAQTVAVGFADGVRVLPVDGRVSPVRARPALGGRFPIIRNSMPMPRPMSFERGYGSHRCRPRTGRQALRLFS